MTGYDMRMGMAMGYLVAHSILGCWFANKKPLWVSGFIYPNAHHTYAPLYFPRQSLRRTRNTSPKFRIESVSGFTLVIEP